MKSQWQGLIAWIAASATTACTLGLQPDTGSFRNQYDAPDDRGKRVYLPTYLLHRAWVQTTRDLATTEVVPVMPLNIESMGRHSFAVAWLGHAALLLRAGNMWILIDPALSQVAGPLPGIGPVRLTPLPIAHLPHIDLVLISHDHYDHLDRGTVRNLAAQPGGAPRFFVGRGLGSWFKRDTGTAADEFDWWQSHIFGELTLQFVPAQHNSGRTPWARHTTLWGGWVIAYQGKRFYFAGDTAYVPALFREIGRRAGPIDVAALPIGAYQPRTLMRHEHLDPIEAVKAYEDLDAKVAFGVHWSTFQLGDEEPFDAARDLQTALQSHPSVQFGLSPIGTILPLSDTEKTWAMLTPPAQLQSVMATSQSSR